MTDKEELIRAAETLKKYCEEHRTMDNSDCYDKCPLSGACEYVDWLHGLYHQMRYVLEVLRND